MKKYLAILTALVMLTGLASANSVTLERGGGSPVADGSDIYIDGNGYYFEWSDDYSGDVNTTFEVTNGTGDVVHTDTAENVQDDSLEWNPDAQFDTASSSHNLNLTVNVNGSYYAHDSKDVNTFFPDIQANTVKPEIQNGTLTFDETGQPIQFEIDVNKTDQNETFEGNIDIEDDSLEYYEDIPFSFTTGTDSYIDTNTSKTDFSETKDYTYGMSGRFTGTDVLSNDFHVVPTQTFNVKYNTTTETTVGTLDIQAEDSNLIRQNITDGDNFIVTPESATAHTYPTYSFFHTDDYSGESVNVNVTVKDEATGEVVSTQQQSLNDDSYEFINVEFDSNTTNYVVNMTASSDSGSYWATDEHTVNGYVPQFDINRNSPTVANSTVSLGATENMSVDFDVEVSNLPSSVDTAEVRSRLYNTGELSNVKRFDYFTLTEGSTASFEAKSYDGSYFNETYNSNDQYEFRWDAEFPEAEYNTDSFNSFRGESPTQFQIEVTSTSTIDSFVVGQPVQGTISDTFELSPDNFYDNGDVTYYYQKPVVVETGSNTTVWEDNWERIQFTNTYNGNETVSKTVSGSIDLEAENSGEYAYRIEVAKANATYNWDTDNDDILDSNQGWRDFTISEAGAVSYEYEVASADQPLNPFTALGNFFDSIIDDVVDSVTGVFNDTPTAVPQPENPPTPSGA